MLQQPQYSMSFEDSGTPAVSGASPEVSKLTKRALQTLTATIIPDVPDTQVKLPSGIVRNGTVLQEAEVAELTGAHEEELARARTSTNPMKFISTILMCGTVSVGDEKMTSALIDEMLQGDLDSLLLAISRVTFGDDFALDGVECPQCSEITQVNFKLSDIPVKSLEDPEVREFSVSLRKGRRALVTFPTGKVQTETFRSKTPLTLPEINSISLAMCVKSFTEVDGTTRACTGLSDVKQLGIADRNKIINFIYTNQPGPRYDQVTAMCPKCEESIPIPLNVGLLFREI